jgi:serine/threonine-protein kinase RsbW
MPSLPPDVIAVEAISHPLAVREMLADLMARLQPWDLPEDDLQRVELVVAEALNNVYEHACGYADGIYVAATARLDPPLVRIEVVDRGAPMPGLALPERAERRSPAEARNLPREAMPEGGWGWMLIRDLTRSVHYERRDDGNHLHLLLPLGVT